MIHHGYASTYSDYLRPHIDKSDQTKLIIVEIGILHGTGLAIWCDLFPNSECIGLDLTPSFFFESKQDLIERGAFRHTQPDVYEFDQFVDNRKMITRILDGKSIDICIDDGCHREQAIVNTFECIHPHLSKVFVYFIEDNDKIGKIIQDRFPQYRTESYGELTVVTPRLVKSEPKNDL